MNTGLLRMSTASYHKGRPSRVFGELGQIQPVVLSYDRFDRLMFRCEGVTNNQASYVGWVLPMYKHSVREELSNLIQRKNSGEYTKCKKVWIRDTLLGVYGEDRKIQMEADIKIGKYRSVEGDPECNA